MGEPTVGSLIREDAGVADKGQDELSPDAPKFRIDATVLFGGPEVKH